MCTSVFRTQPFPRGRKFPCAAILRQRGISLIELIMFIVIVSVGVAGILLVMNQVVTQSADPLLRKQALAVAESMLEEIQLQGLSGVACTGTLGANADRTGASSVCDYNGYHTTGGVMDFATNSVVSGLAGYNIVASVTNISALPGGTFGGTPIPAGSGVQITVTVTDPSGGVVTATGYRAGR
jgi:MSHA pilin protein MshD